MRTCRLSWQAHSLYHLDEALLADARFDVLGVVEDMMRSQLYHYLCDELGVGHSPHNEAVDAIARKASFTHGVVE